MQEMKDALEKSQVKINDFRDNMSPQVMKHTRELMQMSQSVNDLVRSSSEAK